MRVLHAAGASAALLFAFLGRTASATPIPIEITGDFNSNFYHFTIIGPGFEYRISTGEGPFSIGACTTTPCNIEASYSAGVPSVQFANSATLNGTFAPQTGGEIRVSFPLGAGAAPGNRFSTTVPFSLVAQITGFAGEFESMNRGEPLFALTLGGAGDALAFGRTLPDGSTVVDGADFRISGTAEQVPEPVTVGLVGAGLIALALVRKRVRRP